MNPFERRTRGGGPPLQAAHGRGAAVIPLQSRARSFIVLTTQRTGSSWLMDRLDRSPELEGHMELFYLDARREPARAGCNDYPRFVESRGTTARGRRPWATFRYLDALYARRIAVGFKLMYSQLRVYPEILPWLLWRRLPVVHLLRRNHLDVVISEALARATGASHATVQEGSRQRPQRVRLDPDDAVRRIARLQRKQRAMRRLLRLLPNPVFEVSYEALCADPAAFDRLFRFLAVDPALIDDSSRLVKRQRLARSEAVENHAELRDALVAAGHGELLEEDR